MNRRVLLLLLSVCIVLLLCVKYSYISGSFLALVSDLKIFHKHDINCSAIYEMDPVEVGKSLVIRRTKAVEDTDQSLVGLTSNCLLFLQVRGYDKMCYSEEEKQFPLAFSLVVHKSAWLVERLIRVLYSPSNIYCIHYDQKSSPRFISAMKGLARCLPNVFIASKLESVFYASFSRLKADLNCLSDLLSSEVKWKYVINLCGQDFPLKSNIELVSELNKLNGANMVETCRPSEVKKQRFTFHHELQDTSYEYQKLPVKTDQLKTAPPHGIEMFTGNAYFVLSREFVLHVSSSDVARDFLAWSEDTYSPDEHFWATLVRLPGVPGEVPRSQPDITDKMSKTRLVKWHYLEEYLYPPCTGTHVRSVCIYGAAELRWLLNYGHWFANKFDPKVDPVLIQCLEEKLEEKQKLLLSVTQKVCQEAKSGATVSFRTLLRNRSQKEFEKNRDEDKIMAKKQKELEAASEAEEKRRLSKELTDAQNKARGYSLANIKFISELFKLKMLTELYMHDCVCKPLKYADEKSLEYVCRLLFTIGKDLDSTAEPRMNFYFNRMKKIIKERKLTNRIRLMLRDLQDLRQNKWVPQRDDRGPKTVAQRPRRHQAGVQVISKRDFSGVEAEAT